MWEAACCRWLRLIESKLSPTSTPDTRACAARSTPDSRLPTPDSRLPTPDRLHLTTQLITNRFAGLPPYVFGRLAIHFGLLFQRSRQGRKALG